MSDILDTRDILQELDALLDRRDDEEQTDPLDSDESERIDVLLALRSDIGDEFDYGVSLIPEGDFEDHAREMASDVVEDFDKKSSEWPFSCIDWEHAARELRHDYSTVDFDGESYLFRG